MADPFETLIGKKIIFSYKERFRTGILDFANGKYIRIQDVKLLNIKDISEIFKDDKTRQNLNDYVTGSFSVGVYEKGLINEIHMIE